MRRGFQRLLEQARKIIAHEGRIHYTELAAYLKVSPGYASQIARAAAEYYPDVQYVYGYAEYIGGREEAVIREAVEP